MDSSIDDIPTGQVDERYMREALRLARRAAEAGDVPIGCVIVHADQIIAEGYNMRNQRKTALGHAEMIAIQAASEKLGDWRLEGCTMYVTLEPCPMCAGAVVQARIPRVVVGAMNPKAGCAGSILNLLRIERFNHQAELVTGLLEEESRRMLQEFFRKLRGIKKTADRESASLGGMKRTADIGSLRGQI